MEEQLVRLEEENAWARRYERLRRDLFEGRGLPPGLPTHVVLNAKPCSPEKEFLAEQIRREIVRVRASLPMRITISQDLYAACGLPAALLGGDPPDSVAQARQFVRIRIIPIYDTSPPPEYFAAYRAWRQARGFDPDLRQTAALSWMAQAAAELGGEVFAPWAVGE